MNKIKMKNNIIDYPDLIKPVVLTPEKKKYIDAMNQYITELRKKYDKVYEGV